MKKLLLGLFLISSALAFSARVVKFTETVVKDNLRYAGQETTPYTGVVETYSEQGVLIERLDYKNGQADGSSKLYFPNGKLASEATFKNNVQVGVQKDYDENGKLVGELSFKNGKRDGVAKRYYPNGKVHIEAVYKNNLLDGPAKTYDENGKIIQQATFKNGKEIKNN